MLYILTKFNGEHLHKTHHKHPRQIKRGEYDLKEHPIRILSDPCENIGIANKKRIGMIRP